MMTDKMQLPPEAQKVQLMRESGIDYISKSGFWDIPTMSEQRETGKRAVDLRGKARMEDPYLDAILAFWFDYYTKLKSREAETILRQLADSIGRPYDAIPALESVPRTIPPIITTGRENPYTKLKEEQTIK